MITQIKKLLEEYDEEYLCIFFPDDGVQMLSTFDPDELIQVLNFLIEQIEKSKPVYVHNGNTH